VTVHRIDDPDDPRVHEYLHLTDMALRTRTEPASGIYLAESAKVIRRALAAGHQPISYLMGERWLDDLADVVEDADRLGVPVYIGDKRVLQEITGFHLHRGAIAAMHRPAALDPFELVRSARRVVVLEDIVDHTNVGACFRSAAGLGVDVVLVTPRCADPLYRRSVRVSMGTVFQVPWARIDPWPASVTALQAAGFTVAALALSEDAVSLDELAAAPPERLALVLGTEGDGLRSATVSSADLVVRIPMSAGVDSLNVAAASAVAFWALR
jgi:tRNA G18 (ribose-2'-O)-methylase SpoU